MNTITDNSILVEEARFALREMKKHGFSAEESLETVDSYINRVRAVCIAELMNYVIDTKLTEIQRCALRDFWFNDITPDETAEKTGVSVRTVYASRARAQEILKDYLEPLVMYLRSMPSSDVMPAVIKEGREILRAREQSGSSLGKALESIRLNFGAGTELAASALGIKEKELIKKEKSNVEPTLPELETYSRAFGARIILEFNNGKGEIRWN